jgi:hypothetical protein
MKFGAILGFFLCVVHSVVVWRVVWFPDLQRCLEADLGLFAATVAVSTNVIGAALMIAVNQLRLFVLEPGTPYLKPWCATTIISFAVFLGFIQWYLIGRLLGCFIDRWRKRGTPITP